jgi:hypothetical protein
LHLNLLGYQRLKRLIALRLMVLNRCPTESSGLAANAARSKLAAPRVHWLTIGVWNGSSVLSNVYEAIAITQ